jgi:tripartite-type tricarboxylate transporter receptor subunit TctC
MPNLHFVRRAALVIACAALVAPAALAQTPTSGKPLRWLVGYPPGGGSDTIARIVSAPMGQALNQTVVVENKPGASANIAGSELVRSPADGSTVMNADNGLLIFNPAMYKKMGFAPDKDMKPVGLLARLHLLIAVQPDHPANSYKELVDWIRSQKQPVQYAASSIGSPLHLAMARLAGESKLDLVHVPYKGAAPAIADFLGKVIPVICIDYSTAAQYVKSGKMKVLAVTSAKRLPPLPNVPTVAESGGPAGFEAYAWQGVVVPAGTPDPVVQNLNRALNASLAQQAVADRLTELGIEPTPSTTAEFTAFWNREAKTWQPLIQTLGIAMD